MRERILKMPYKRKDKNHEQEIKRTGEDSGICTPEALPQTEGSSSATELAFEEYYSNLAWPN